jgi:hypothetical protein
MVMHKKSHAAEEPHFWVMASMSEPKYETEWKFLAAEQAYVRNKLAEGRPRGLGDVSIPALGFFSHKDWRKYAHQLDKYAEKLADYADDVKHGVLPVKFSVFNNAGTSAQGVAVHIKVADGRLDEHKKAPERPVRLDGRGKAAKFKLPALSGFTRSGITITAHKVSAELSVLAAHDGAAVVNQVLHVHCGPDTLVTYELASRNGVREAGEVEIAD